MFWPDIQTVIDHLRAVRNDGFDEWSRPRWLIAGAAADGEDIEIVCVLDVDAYGDTTVFITVYWQE